MEDVRAVASVILACTVAALPLTALWSWLARRRGRVSRTAATGDTGTVNDGSMNRVADLERRLAAEVALRREREVQLAMRTELCACYEAIIERLSPGLLGRPKR